MDKEDLMFRYIYEKRTCSRLFSPTRSRSPRRTIICQQFKTEELGTSISLIGLVSTFSKPDKKKTTNFSFYTSVFEPTQEVICFWRSRIAINFGKKKGDQLQKTLTITDVLFFWAPPQWNRPIAVPIPQSSFLWEGPGFKKGGLFEMGRPILST